MLDVSEPLDFITGATQRQLDLLEVPEDVLPLIRKASSALNQGGNSPGLS